jgi:hypothetical protein
MIDMAEKLILNTLTFDYPAEPVKFYFSSEDDAQHKSSILKSPVLVPAEVKAIDKFSNMFAGMGCFKMYTTFDLPTAGFEEIEVDFHLRMNTWGSALITEFEEIFSVYDDLWSRSRYHQDVGCGFSIAKRKASDLQWQRV